MDLLKAGDKIECPCGNDHALTANEAASLERGERVEYPCIGNDLGGRHQTRLWLDGEGRPHTEIVQSPQR